MRCYRKNGKISAFLKLRLPESDGSSDGCSVFDGFYIELAQRYLSLGESAPCASGVGCRPTGISVDFSVATDLYMREHPRLSKKYKCAVVIKRWALVNINGEIKKDEYYDVFDVAEGVFVK